jgi:predicted  nucleic acid-binding Zn-ribbon protein
VYGKIDALTQQVQEKETELSRERENVRALSEQLQNLQATSSGFETLAIQGKEILQKLEEQQVKADEDCQKAAEEYRDRPVLQDELVG